MPDLIWTFLVGIAASLVSGIAGGGAGLISAPFFILIGLPPQVAVATTKFGTLGLTAGSLARFRTTGHIRREHVIYLSVLSITAALVGSQLLLISPDALVEKLVGAIMLIAIPFLFIKNIGLARTQPSPLREASGYVLYFTILVLQAAFGAGIGTAVALILMGLMGFTALEAAATRRIPGLLLGVVALLVYVLNDVVHYGHGLALLSGMLLGGYLGTHIAIKRGNAFVKIVFAIVVGALSVKLLTG